MNQNSVSLLFLPPQALHAFPVETFRMFLVAPPRRRSDRYTSGMQREFQCLRRLADVPSCINTDRLFDVQDFAWLNAERGFFVSLCAVCVKRPVFFV